MPLIAVVNFIKVSIVHKKISSDLNSSNWLLDVVFV